MKKMFYNKDEVDKNLNCPICGKKFESPKIVVPCFQTFCLKCIQESSIDDNFMCRACDKEHKIPEKGFEPNDVVERLLKTKYGLKIARYMYLTQLGTLAREI